MKAHLRYPFLATQFEADNSADEFDGKNRIATLMMGL
jgi:hypothetical protein